MIKITPLDDARRDEFAKLFGQYYAELDCADDAAQLIDEYIIPALLAGLIRIDLLFDGETLSGFVIYQIDDIDNDWNLKEGWGDVREIYVIPSARRKGLGKFLLYTAEMKLKESGARSSYCLPCDGAIAFFAACGYVDGGCYCEALDCPVFEKNKLNERCHE